MTLYSRLTFATRALVLLAWKHNGALKLLKDSVLPMSPFVRSRFVVDKSEGAKQLNLAKPPLPTLPNLTLQFLTERPPSFRYKFSGLVVYRHGSR